MKISEIYIKNYLQFRDFHLDLTYPDTGEALDKICFIGANGTGKSNLLKIILAFIEKLDTCYTKLFNLESIFENLEKNSLIYFCVREKLESVHILILKRNTFYYSERTWNKYIYEMLSDANFSFSELSDREQIMFQNKSYQKLSERLRLFANADKHVDEDIVSYAQPDRVSLIENSDLPNTNLNQALPIFDFFPLYHDISYSNVDDFWKILIYHIKKRERDYLRFLESVENQDLKVNEVKRKFEQENPEILSKLSEQWNLILERAGLEFDVENAKIPVQLNDNLEAYIRLKNSKQNILYNNLSTGIRNFIFQLGHIYTLYFNRDIKRGFLLIDEPELSLFPDLLYDLIERYLSIIQNTQFFVATHNPIIAAQFEPAERFILEFNDEGFVEARLGVSPEGDDPNDLLVNDFVVRSLYGKKGIEQWHKYLSLRREINETEDIGEKKKLLKEYSKIGNAYNFLPNEISE